MRQVKQRLSWMSVVVGLVFTVLAVHQTGLLAQNAAKEHRLSVRKIKNEWRVVQSDDSTKSTVTAKKGDRIVWVAEGSDMYFQFMEAKLFGDYTRKLKKGQKLVLTVGRLAKAGVNHYAVFCAADNAFARGESPPAIIIESNIID